MTRALKASALVLLALLFLAPEASAWPHHVVIGGGWGWGGWGWGPGWWGPGPYWGYDWGWGPGYYGYYAPAPNAGKVKIVTKMKDASVYVDDGYGGTVEQLKTFSLRPGKHTIELRTHDGHSIYQERINVIAGKTLDLHPD